MTHVAKTKFAYKVPPDTHFQSITDSISMMFEDIFAPNLFTCPPPSSGICLHVHHHPVVFVYMSTTIQWYLFTCPPPSSGICLHVHHHPVVFVYMSTTIQWYLFTCPPPSSGICLHVHHHPVVFVPSKTGFTLQNYGWAGLVLINL